MKLKVQWVQGPLALPLGFKEGNMMLMCVLVLTALLASDVAGTTDSLGPEETQQDLEMRALSEGPCAENWFYFPKLGSCYQFFSHKKTWSDAEAFCKQQAHYGHLATVTSSEHNTFIINVIAAVIKGNPFAWIGLNDRCEEGTFTWIDGSPSSYRHWGGNQPDNHEGNEDCAHTDYDGLWNDLPCGVTIGFVCSYKPGCH
ncbi:C-type lectin LmsL-like [Rhinoraja longicauda]